MVQQPEYSLRTKSNMRNSNVLDVICGSAIVFCVIGFCGRLGPKTWILPKQMGLFAACCDSRMLCTASGYHCIQRSKYRVGDQNNGMLLRLYVYVDLPFANQACSDIH